MKILFPLSAIFLLGAVSENCGSNKKQTPNTRYKAKLEIQALCMNYTIRLLEGDLDSSMITPKWTDETNGKPYQNVFALANPCDFPSTIKQGDEFYFSIDTISRKNCAVCMAYYPTPPKKLFIKIVDK
jgi:hypothetical protein